MRGVLVPVRRGLHAPQTTARVRQRREAVWAERASYRGRGGTLLVGRRQCRPGRLHDMGHWSRQP
ncbi:hypothetical protein B0675_17985 [Streptomyces sp. M41(2017)]|nr:hypothetical protein B0675_17985 [Streptomyces sp. M41(2017)]